jgi:hypothetical protein
MRTREPTAAIVSSPVALLLAQQILCKMTTSSTGQRNMRKAGNYKISQQIAPDVYQLQTAGRVLCECCEAEQTKRHQ